MTTPGRKIRIAVPYTERLFTVPSCNFATLAEALWNTTRDDCEVVRLHESELLERDDYDVVFLIRKTGTGPAFLEQFARTGKRIAIWLDDLHCYHWRVPCVSKRRMWLFDRVDLIFVTSFHHFHLWKPYRRFLDKVVWSPFSVPDWIFEYSRPWEARANRVLVSGACGVHYPLRQRLFKYAHSGRQDVLDALEHPGYEATPERHGTMGRAFFQLLGSYKGAVATTGSNWLFMGRKLDYTVAKYIEIPACGCLPFMEETPDLGELGFREGEHYVSINRWNYQKRFGAIFSAEAESIALAAQELIRQRHTHSHRVGLILDEITRRLRTRE